MQLSAKMVRERLAHMKPLLENCSLETLRKGQNALGEVMKAARHTQVRVKRHDFPLFSAAWVLPRDARREGVILYLHGGGYTCGGLEYALGFGAALADECGVRVFCAAYRLAPEHRFPAAVEDGAAAYRYLLEKGYPPEQISLCGESAGGGLCFSLCMYLRQQELPLPGSIVAISPWTDLTCNRESYETNRERDVSLSEQQLKFFAECYTDTPEDPLASPLLGDLKGMPPSLIFVGGDEILLSDSKELHRKLREQGTITQLVVRPERWHAYVLYGLQEDRQDFVTLGAFLSRYLSRERKLRWMRLDNAAKIYPAALRQSWSNVFRLSVTLGEQVDRQVLQSALDVTVRRFPSICVRLRRGLFWYYLQQLSQAPKIREESSYPLTRMSRKEVGQCAFRVIVYQNRIAVEFFHAVTDGNGGLVFLKTLTAEYLQQKYGVSIPAGEGVLGRLEAPREEELEDSFLKYAGNVNASRRENNAWRPWGTPEQDGFLNLTCFRLDTAEALEKAHAYGVSLTEFLCAALMLGLQNLQQERVSNPKRRKPIRVQVPVNLRKLFPSSTLRNFALYTTPEIDPRLGSYSFSEICQAVHHRLGLDVNPKVMSSRIAVNVSSEKQMIVRVMPLFLKNMVMKAVFNQVGEKKCCLCMSNLGQVKLPEEMLAYVQRMDFILGVQATAPQNCGCVSFGGNLYINFIRNIREPELEAHFFRVLRDLGLRVEVQTNARE
ncbi:MAG: alpha/beta hydrolase fold domain-containing protein [Candidatus Faecousia sp.]|nr:alpha/beta hydrolase fold domain-containing protein [Clostridiales bacterium]MDY6179955.1 alpha/beta hydrolase fold domain-containing protein [Candidatus Faecousia sp.]